MNKDQTAYHPAVGDAGLNNSVGPDGGRDGESRADGTCAVSVPDHPALTTLLPEGEAEIVGRLREASNQTFLLRVAPPGVRTGAEAAVDHAELLRPPSGVVQGVYKPLRGERALWDFPEHTLGLREVAAYQVSRMGGFDVVPVTTLIDGPFGTGSLQIWVESDSQEVDRLIDLVPSEEVPESGWFDIVQGWSVDDQPISLIHADDTRLRLMALLDTLINNADRKGGHVLASGGRVFGVDHGICFHSEEKLRTLLWGWAGQPLTEPECARVQAVQDHAVDVLEPLLSSDEVEALLLRSEELLRTGRFPHPAGDWHDIPWPPF